MDGQPGGRARELRNPRPAAPSSSSPGRVGADENHTPPVVADRWQGPNGLDAATEPLVAGAALPRRARTDDPAGARKGAVTFEISFDFIEHCLAVATSRGALESFELVDGLSAAEFDENLHRRSTGSASMSRSGRSRSAYRRRLPSQPAGSIPLTTENAVGRFWRILDWTDQVLEEFASSYLGKTSPVHLFWHSFDRALTRSSGRQAPAIPETDPVTQGAYSHEVISFGFWAGDEHVREPMYSYAAPEPEGLAGSGLQPEDAFWSKTRSSSLALLPYDAVRKAADPRSALLAFLTSAYRAGADASQWRSSGPESSRCPSVQLGEV
jgi:Family of unknown function (DUF5996)